MKFTLMFKDPDGVFESLKDAGVINDDGTAKEGQEDAKALVDKYVEFNEYLYLEVDTEAGTVTILEAD